MIRAPSISFIGVMLTSLFLVASCSQDEGDTCQVNSDCSDGLVCCRGASAERGFCGNSKDTECGGGDTTTDTDSGLGDASIDASSSDDGGSTDASTDSGQDAASSDDGGGDGG